MDWPLWAQSLICITCYWKWVWPSWHWSTWQRCMESWCSTQFGVANPREWGSMACPWKQFRRQCSRFEFNQQHELENYTFKLIAPSPRGQWVNLVIVDFFVRIFNTAVDIKLKHWADKQLPTKCVEVGYCWLSENENANILYITMLPQFNRKI